ncbi:N-acylphosphatidylethanolamine synthase isoform X2 [Physcomitrium patens]|uniref:N-acylphosphatidylethanolamine synthase isoform X2 n=1 Tax=Physcomitrium patens TaxID=3218 RepID=UPI003CCD0769
MEEILHGSRSAAAPRTITTLANVAKGSHLGGIPRRMVLTTVGAITKFYGILLNNTKVHNGDTLLSLVKSRPPGTPLVTVSNHMSTLDDPLMWGIRGLPLADPKRCRWTLAAEDICFTNVFFSYFFRLGKCIPITRGAGIYQPHMAEALERLNEGEWLNTFPEGKVCQELGPLRRLKWGTASLIARAKVMPENYWNGRRPLLPLVNKNVDIVVGEPMVFDIPRLKQAAVDLASASVDVASSGSVSSEADDRKFPLLGSSMKNPNPLTKGITRLSSIQQVANTLETMKTNGADVPGPLLDEAAWRWIYTHITEHIWVALSEVTQKARTIGQLRADS